MNEATIWGILETLGGFHSVLRWKKRVEFMGFDSTKLRSLGSR
jgi:hypothetical protein